MTTWSALTLTENNATQAVSRRIQPAKSFELIDISPFITNKPMGLAFYSPDQTARFLMMIS
jgi:hypothetical protein